MSSLYSKTLILIIISYIHCSPIVKITDLEKAKEILDRHPLIDGHNDLAWMIRRNFRNDIELFDLNDIKKNLTKHVISHTDINRIKEGHLKGQFWAIYASCSSTGKDATRIHLEQIDLIKRIINKYPDFFQLVTSSDELEDAFQNNKFASLMGMESAHAIDSSMGLLRIFYELGVRYMTLTHNCDVPWATNNLVDNKPNPEQYGGLNEFGRKIVKEMNRLGMIVDISHVSTQTMRDALDASKAPVMFSHSSVYALCNHTRNVKDDVLDKLKENNGVIMINFYNEFLTCSLDATVENGIKHIEYVKNRIGIDHIGIGADYDGVDLTPVGAEDVSKYVNIFAGLIDKGWSDADLIKLAGGNVMRVIKDVEKYSMSVKSQVPSSEEIPEEFLKNNEYANIYAQCRTKL